MTEKIILKGTKIVIGTHAGMAGTDNLEAYVLRRDYTESELVEIAHQEGLDWAEMYGIYPYPENYFDFEEEEDDGVGNQYSDSIEGWWELYDEEEHAGSCSYANNGVVFNEL